jgi:flagellar motor switch protein FliM
VQPARPLGHSPTKPTRHTRPTGRARRRALPAEATAYDFRRPIQLSREHQRTLHGGFDAFARQATTVFTSALRTVCQVSVTSIEQRSYAEYVDLLGGTTYLTTFSAEPMPGVGMLEIPLQATMVCIDHMLGGPGTAEQPDRPLTDIEGGVARGLVDRLLAAMRYSLGDVVAIEPVALGVEYSPQFAQVAAGADVMVVISLELRIDENAHRMTVCLPFSGLHPQLTAAAQPAAVSDRERTERTRAAELLDRQFRSVPVDLSVRFRATPLDPATLADLRPGDVLRLAHPASAPLDVTVDGTTFAHATPGARGNRLAALVVDTPQERP